MNIRYTERTQVTHLVMPEKYYYNTANIINSTHATKINSRQFNRPISQETLLQLLLMSQLPN